MSRLNLNARFFAHLSFLEVNADTEEMSRRFCRLIEASEVDDDDNVDVINDGNVTDVNAPVEQVQVQSFDLNC